MVERRETSLKSLMDVMDQLLGENGCPWDKEQTHQSLKRYLLEETHEVIQAINTQDMKNLQEELGDVLLQIIFHAKLTEAKGLFTMEDVIQGISDKLIRRHPHVFNDEIVNSADEVVTNWDAIKAQEKGRPKEQSLLGDIPETLPALLKAYKVQEKAKGAGLDLSQLTDPWKLLDEQKENLKKAMEDQRDEEKAIGDLLFAVVNVIHTSKADPENSLLSAIGRFKQAVELIEADARMHNISLEEYTVEELKQKWQQVTEV